MEESTQQQGGSLQKRIEKSPKLHLKMMKHSRVIEKILTYEDVCEYLGKHPINSLPYPNPTTKKQVFVNASSKMDDIGEVFRGDWEADYSDEKQKKWYYWHIWDKVSSGFVFNSTHYGGSLAGTSSASRLCFPDKQTAECVGSRFLSEINEFLNPQIPK